MNDSWNHGQPYDQFMGRWSALVADVFLRWLNAPAAGCWLDAGCGTGGLARQIVSSQRPHAVTGIDFAHPFLAYAQIQRTGTAIHYAAADMQALPLPDNSIDTAVSGISLNFVPRPERALAKMIRVTRPGGHIGIFLWDYAAGMEMLRFFWDTAVSLDPCAADRDEGRRFPLCNEQALAALVQQGGLEQVNTRPIDVPARFATFADYWQPFLGQVGPAPDYVASLTPTARAHLRDQLQIVLPAAEDGTIVLTARAWAVQGTLGDQQWT